jgi:hypothetical protein
MIVIYATKPARRQVWENLLKKDDGSGCTPDGWGIDVWLLIEAAISGYHIKEVFMVSNSEQVEFTIIREAIKYGRLELQKRIDV